jgi:hypothetical protein
MSSDILKMAVYDDRIVQTRPKYGVFKGGVSVNNQRFQAISKSTSQLTFQLTAPSENVFVDRAIDFTATVNLAVDVSVGGGTAPLVASAGQQILRFGSDCALCAFPLATLMTTLQATINDTTVAVNLNDTIREILRFTDLDGITKQRTCPTMLDVYASYNDAISTNNNPLSDYTTSVLPSKVANGAYYNVSFTQPNGSAFPTTPTTFVNALNGQNINVVNGIPVLTADATIPANCQSAYRLYVQFTSTEKLILSPFIFSDDEEYSTGLFGIQQVNFTMNMTNPSISGNVGRVLRSTSAAVGGFQPQITAVNYNNNVSQGAISSAALNVVFITPSLSLSLPPKSIVPYLEYPRYIDVATLSNAGVVNEVPTQTITLPVVPDLLVVYVKPQSYANSTAADFYCPIYNVSLNFDNFSGLLSSHSQEELYHIAVRNGLQMDYNQWVGEAKKSIAGAPTADAGSVQLTGGFLVLRPGVDFALSEGLAPGVIGNYVLQMNLRVLNPTGAALPVNVYTMTVNSGFFETVSGSSRIIRGPLNSADVIEAPMAPEAPTRGSLQRLVGGASFNLANVLSKAKDVYDVVKQVAPMVKPMMPSKAKDMMSAIGLGVTGAASGGGKKMLSSRLM